MEQVTENKGYKSVWDFGREAKADIGPHGIGEYPTKILPHAVHRLVKKFSEENDTILDPFCGSGTTAVEAKYHNRNSINYDINENAINLTEKKLKQNTVESQNVPLDKKSIKESTIDKEIGLWEGWGDNDTQHIVELNDSRKIPQKDESIESIITDIPYSDMIEYSEKEDDLSTFEDYNEFLNEIDECIGEMWRVLKPGKYCCIFCADNRVGSARRIFPLHSDIIQTAEQKGFVLFDLFVWRYYRSGGFRPFGKRPFQAMNTHSYIVVFYKPEKGDDEILKNKNGEIKYRDELKEKVKNNR